MKATYWQRGEALDYTNSTAETIPGNTVIDIKTRIGVVGNAIEPGQHGALHVEGVFEIAKKSGEEVAFGDLLYFDGTEITKTADTNTPAGYAAAPATASATKVLVKLLG